VATEPVWIVDATYAPDAAESRVPFRPQHAARMLDLQAQGIVVDVGAFDDMSASMVILRVPTEAEALDICRQDIYPRNGVWVEFRTRRFNLLIPG
jgi:uncharacterized protein YciI